MEFVPLHSIYPKIYKYSISILISDVYKTSMFMKIEEIQRKNEKIVILEGGENNETSTFITTNDIRKRNPIASWIFFKR